MSADSKKQALPPGTPPSRRKGEETCNLFTIPSGVPFARALAEGLLEQAEGDVLALARMRVLLPTRRACRSVREAFLQQSEGKPLLLPRLQPIGDVEEEELAIAAADGALAEEILSLPPAMPSLRRRILLARIVMKLPSFAHGPEQALALAGALGMLMDQVHTEGLDLANLPGLVDREFARHWEITTEFLTILSAAWPAILAERGMIDSADRRNRLLNLLARHWRENPPEGPVIAAGSTGSIPATAGLLDVIARLPQGCVVLPGLDREMDEESWDALDDTHPQATLKQLLERMKVARTDVKLWHEKNIGETSGRLVLANEVMRPAATTEQWNRLALRPERMAALHGALDGIERHDCETPEEEARVIALVFRKTLEQDGKTAALVTPDRDLARRAAMTCRRWGLEIDDSAGQPLPETEIGGYLRLIAHCAAEKIAPAALLSLLRHPLCHAGLDNFTLGWQAGRLEKSLLRGPKPPPGFGGLRNRAGQLLSEHPEWEARLRPVLELLDRLEAAMKDLLTLSDGQAHPPGLWLEHHLRSAEALAATPENTGASLLWRGEAGEEAARFFATLREDINDLPPLDAAGYLSALTQLMQTVTIRPRHGAHPRLMILGQLEARLLQADIVILSGLNEKSWPPDPGHDPWLSRPMRARFGLPSPERAIGLAAHDFVQGFCAGHVVLTRSLRQDGAPTVPARWLQRFDAVLQATGAELPPAEIAWPALARAMDHSNESKPGPRPAPCPPVERRPRELPVTAIETWLQDPYSLYAKYILKLRKLDPLEQPPDAAARGKFLHEVLDRFVKACPDILPGNAAQILKDLGHKYFESLMDDSGFWRYWLPRFDRIADWIALHEVDWRQQARPAKLESQGRMALDGPAGPFTLTARADRIDRLKAGGYAIIDYKTGGAWSAKAMIDGKLPQLPLEGLILEQNGFEGISGKTTYLGYWKLTGGVQEGDIKAIEDSDAATAIAGAHEGLRRLIETYDRADMPYLSLPDPERVPRFQDYAHLARVQEWSLGDDEAGEAA